MKTYEIDSYMLIRVMQELERMKIEKIKKELRKGDKLWVRNVTTLNVTQRQK